MTIYEATNEHFVPKLECDWVFPVCPGQRLSDMNLLQGHRVKAH